MSNWQRTAMNRGCWRLIIGPQQCFSTSPRQQPSEMKKACLVAFDFDGTLTNKHSLHVWKPTNIHKSETEAAESLTNLADYGTKMFKELKVRGYDFWNVLGTVKSVEPSPDIELVLKFFAERDCEMIVTSNNASIIVEEWLSTRNFRGYFRKLHVHPSRVDEQGDFVVDSYRYNNCPYSHKSLCKGDALESHILERKNEGVTFNRVLYFGDTYTDYCPVLRLSENDIVFPRKSFLLEKMLAERKDHAVTDIRASIYPWSSGKDILNIISNIL